MKKEIKTKFDVGDTVYYIGNSSYLFESKKEIEGVIEKHKIIDVVTINVDVDTGKQKVQYKTNGKDNNYPWEYNLYSSKKELFIKVWENNMDFLKSLLRDAKKRLKEYESNAEICKRNIEKYKEMKKVL